MEFDLQHALSCKKGDFVSLRQSHILKITVSLLTELCKIEPPLQQLTGQIIQLQTITTIIIFYLFSVIMYNQNHHKKTKMLLLHINKYIKPSCFGTHQYESKGDEVRPDSGT